MKVLKFGGTSVGSPQRMKDVCRLVSEDGEQKVVVLSAMSGTTNTLIEITKCYHAGDRAGAFAIIERMRDMYSLHISNLYSTTAYKQNVQKYIDDRFDFLKSFAEQPFTQVEEKEIIAQGELLSTFMATCCLSEAGYRAALIPALDFMKIDENGEPDMEFICNNIVKHIDPESGIQIFVTQGFICRNAEGLIDNLQRGGSDYTASIIGAAIKADEIQIWTDIDGMHNNDPRIVNKTQPVRHLLFEEAAELAYFGAKILHPTCVQPAKAAGIPVRLLNTMQPDAPGTLINSEAEPGKIKAVAAKDNITAISIQSSRMLLAYGFLRRIFEIFENHKTSIDMICTSEVGVSMSIDSTHDLDQILNELRELGTVSVETDMCIVCVVGDMKWNNVGFESKALDALSDIPVHMISYGGSSYNISFLIKEEDKKRALQRLSNNLFKK